MAAERRRIAIVTDSMADLPRAWVEELGVRVVPLHVLVGERSYRDGIDLSPREFFEIVRNASAGRLPKTSHPSPSDFVAVYEEVARAADAIVSIHASSDISATYQSAVMASRDFTKVPVEVLDTRLVTLAQGLVVREAARAVAGGAGLDGVLAAARAMMRRIRVRFTVETLEYLWKNGRIGRASAFLGGMLQLKPILAFEDGMVTPVEKVRGRAHSLSRLAELAASGVGDRGETLVIVHGDVPDVAETLRDLVLQRCRFEEIVIGDLGATIGSHAGPGTVAAVTSLKPEA